MSLRNLLLLSQLVVYIVAKEAILKTSATINIPSKRAKVFKNDLRLGLLISNLVILNSQDLIRITPKNADPILETADKSYKFSKFALIQHYLSAHLIQLGISTMLPLIIWHITLKTLSHQIYSYFVSLLKIILILSMDRFFFSMVLEKFGLVLNGSTKRLFLSKVRYYKKLDTKLISLNILDRKDLTSLSEIGGLFVKDRSTAVIEGRLDRYSFYRVSLNIKANQLVKY